MNNPTKYHERICLEMHVIDKKAVNFDFLFTFNIQLKLITFYVCTLFRH